MCSSVCRLRLRLRYWVCKLTNILCSILIDIRKPMLADKEIDPNDPEAQKAATKIQAVFRGHKTRKEMNKEQEEETQNFEEEFSADDKDLCHAATKIQASFRGHKVRKQAEEDKLSKDMEEKAQVDDELADIDLTDPELNKAATKIQASFRGHKVRKETDEQEASSQ